MKDTMKKSLGILLATVGMCTALAGCGTSQYKGDVLDGTFDATATVTSNGGFAVAQGDYVYFINGKDSYDKDNTYGNVVKSALMRISKEDLAKEDYSKVKTVVPSLFVADDYNAGIYIYDGYVYYATPTTYNTMEGDVGNTQIDFKRAKLDGSEAPMKDCFFRLKDKATKYRFVEVDDVVYCMYEESGSLKSYNTTTGDTTVLVSGAKSSFFYDLEKADSPYVYYTMNVKANLNSNNADYDQLYCVRADATVTEIDGAKATYTVSNGYTYDFDEVQMKETNKDGSTSYNFNDYTTYPYVNLGTLVLDGVGKSTTPTQFSRDDISGCLETAGYTYTINSYRNGGLYFTRAAVQKTDSANENAKLYYVADATVQASAWDTIACNADANLETVATNSANVPSTALFDVDDDMQYYFYVENELLYRAGYDNENNQSIAPVQMTKEKIGTATPWKLDRETLDLYFYTATDGGNGNTLSKIRYDGTAEAYNGLLAKEAYQPVSYKYVDFNNSADWYMPEIIEGYLLYANVQSFGSVSYNYVYATKLGTVAEVKANNKKYEAVQEHITATEHSATLQSVMQYYFRTGKTDLYDAVIDEYSASQQKTIADFIEMFGTKKDFENSLQSNFIGMLGKVTEEDAEEMEEAFKNSLLSGDEDDAKDDNAWLVWLFVGIGSALIIAGAVVALCIANAKKKAKKAEEEATVNAYKRKIDTVDDKSIDVYADDETKADDEN